MEQLNILFKESLKSKEYLCSLNNNNYWEEENTTNFSQIISNIFLPFRIIRFTFSILHKYIFEAFRSKLYGKKKRFFLLTRTKGIRDLFSFEDYRFKGLEKKLSKYGQVSFFIHGNYNRFNISLTPRIYGIDLYKISEFCVYGFGVRKKRDKYIWQKDIKILEKSVNILSKLILKETSIFFWDFNIQHCPLLIAGKLKNCSLIGSLHNFTEKGTLPWVESSWPLSKLIKHEFINYKKIFSNKIQFKIADQLKKKTKFTLKKLPKDLMLLEEYFTIDDSGNKRYFSLDWVLQNRSYFRNIYIKARPDKAFTNLFLKECNEKKIGEFILINDLKEIENINDILVVGSYSSYLLELASRRILCISISDKDKHPFDNPAHKLVKLYKKRNQEQQDLTFNPINANSSKNFLELIQINKKYIASNACINHLIFKKFIIDIIFEKMINT